MHSANILTLCMSHVVLPLEYNQLWLQGSQVGIAQNLLHVLSANYMCGMLWPYITMFRLHARYLLMVKCILRVAGTWGDAFKYNKPNKQAARGVSRFMLDSTYCSMLHLTLIRLNLHQRDCLMLIYLSYRWLLMWPGLQSSQPSCVHLCSPLLDLRPSHSNSDYSLPSPQTDLLLRWFIHRPQSHCEVLHTWLSLGICVFPPLLPV